MSKKNTMRNKKLLLDTSFLLPVLGFETNDRIMKVYHRLGSYEVYYSEIGILEALWKIVKIVREEDEIRRVKEGIRAIRETFKYAALDDVAVGNAITMYWLGHRDMIDNLLYSIALSRKIALLTVDNDLIEFLEKNDLPRNHVTTPEELV